MDGAWENSRSLDVAGTAAGERELSTIDISPWKDGNTAIPYAHRFDSGRPGPSVLITALTHGNEFCGAHALDFLLREKVRPRRGQLTLCFVNVAAYESFSPQAPAEARFIQQDMNRLWMEKLLDGQTSSAELDRARRIRPLVDTCDMLLDLHSMQQEGPPMTLSGMTAKCRRLARQLAFPSLIVADEGHRSGRRLRDYGAFSDPASPKTALLVECGQHWKAESRDVAIEASLRFLLLGGMIDDAFAAPYLSPLAGRTEGEIEITMTVTAETDRCLMLRDHRNLEVIGPAGSLIARDGDREIATPYDDCVLIMPSRRAARGQTLVRLGRFVS